MLKTNQYIPQVYGKERTIQVFTKLLDIILACCKYDIDNLGNIYNAKVCPESFLPLLAYTLNYDYNFADTVSSNRSIIECFAIMERWKGSIKGMKMATALGLTSLDISKNNNELTPTSQDYISALQHINIIVDYETGVITIDYPNTYKFVRYILDYVRPVGMTINLRSVVMKDINADVMVISANVMTDVHKYETNVKSKVSRSFVNFSAAVDDTWLDNLDSNNTFNVIGE